MTAGQRVIAGPTLQGRTAAAALGATFAIGLLIGLVTASVRLPSPAVATVSTSERPPSGALYRSYRAGERGDAIGSQVGDRAWQLYRAGERGESLAIGPAQGPAWQTYRAGERGDAPGSTTGSTTASLAAQSRAEAARHHPPAP